MKFKVASSVFGILLSVACISSYAAAAIAMGDDGYTYTMLNQDDMDTAERLALEECRKRVNNCETFGRIAKPGAIALVKGDTGAAIESGTVPQEAMDAAMARCRKANYGNCSPTTIYWEEGRRWAAWAAAVEDNSVIASYYTYDAASKNDAEARALEGCKKELTDAKKELCKIQISVSGRSAFVLASSKSGSHISVDNTIEKAKRAALAGCQRASKAGDVCTIQTVYENPGPVPKPKSFDLVYAKTIAAKIDREEMAQAKPKSVRTNAVQRLTCENQCVNGNCIRTFSDGRKERWQAPRVYDPFSRDWKWDTSSCGQ